MDAYWSRLTESTGKLTFDEYVRAVGETQQRFPHWRRGQTHFNLLDRVRPGLARQVQATDVDPFHQDQRIPSFLAFVYRNWLPS
jgi:hypothetical protein